MRFIYGEFEGQVTDNWACTASDKVGTYANGALTSILATLDFQAVIVAADQYLLSARMAQIQSGILYNGKNVGLLHDNGTPSKLYLDSSQSQSGVLITRFPFPEPNIKGADYASSLTCRASFQAEYSAPDVNPGSGSSNVLVSFTESLGVQGNGGQRTAIQEYITGTPEEFVLADQTACYATQTGVAVVEGFSRDQFSSISSPLFPDLLENDSMGERRTITRLTDKKWSCEIAWEYKFKSTTLIDGSIFQSPLSRR